MASNRDYKQIGVLLPIERDDVQRVLHDARVAPNDEFMRDGFLYVCALQMGFTNRYDAQGQRLRNWSGNIIKAQSIFVVQSVSTGELCANKLAEAKWDPATNLSLPPLEVRVSTYRHHIGDPNIDIQGADANDPQRKGILPDMPCFNKLRWWQELDPQDATNPEATVYSMFFEFCNGGTVRQLTDLYNARATAVPEHFIWLVAEQLFSALVTMILGSDPTQDDGNDDHPDNWAPVYHRDLHAANLFINYPPRGPGRIPRAGVEGNAFPEIVLGDFGASGIQGDDPAILPTSVLGAPPFEEWEDIFSAGEILRELSMTHIPQAAVDLRPMDRWVQDANQQPTAPPYSAELIALLQRFEYPGMTGPGYVGPMDLQDARHTTFPSPEDLRDNLLPQVRARVLALRRPANRPAGYYDAMDVSWTRPNELKPLNYVMRYAAEAGDGPDGGPPSDHDASGSDGSHSDSGSGGHPEGGDVEMPDSPSSSEAGQDGSDAPSDAPQQPEGSGGSGGSGHDQHDDDDNHDDDDGSPADVPPPARPPEVSSERRAMRELRKMHFWNKAKPRYVLRSLEFRVPTILPFKVPP